MTAPKVAVVILNYNQETETEKCLEGLEALSYPAFETVVVDNGSRIGAARTLLPRFPKVSWIALRDNVGFAAGCNEGIRWALARGAEGVLLLNNDARITPDFLDKMAESAFSASDRGVVGAVIYRAPGTPFLAAMRFDFLSARVKRVPPPISGGVVAAVSGSCFFITRKCLEKTGLLDERFFIYFEETDFCYRSRRNRFTVFSDARVHVQHEDGSTFGRQSAALRYLYTRNRYLFLSKHCPLLLKPWSFSVRMAQDFLLALLFLSKGKLEMSRAVRYGVEDYWKGRFWKGRLDSFFHG